MAAEERATVASTPLAINYLMGFIVIKKLLINECKNNFNGFKKIHPFKFWSLKNIKSVTAVYYPYVW